jgi:hypothetical protein
MDVCKSDLPTQEPHLGADDREGLDRAQTVGTVSHHRRRPNGVPFEDQLIPRLTTQLVARRTSNDPPIHRVVFDGVEIGSISRRTRHLHPIQTDWTRGVDVMPLMSHGGRTPSGEAESFEGALKDFKLAFTHWLAGVAPDVWQENLEHKRAGAERWK